MNSNDVNTALVAYLHQELTAEQVEQVEARLLTDAKLRERLLEIAVEEATLIHWARRTRKLQQIDDAESALRAVQELRSELKEASESARPAAPKIFPALKFPKWGDISGAGMFWIGGGLLFGLLALGVWMLWPAGDLPGGSPIARFTHLDGAVWAKGQPTIREGTGIPAGYDLRLTSGLADIAYPGGATLRLSGPAVLKLTDPMHSQLTAGAVSAYVPPEAIGYTIHTAAVDIRDKGTRFGVRIDASSQAEVHVFEGIVETQLPPTARWAAAQQALTITQAARFDRLNGLVDWIRPDYEAFSAKRLAPGVARTSNEVRWLAKAPPSLALGAFADDSAIHLILERQNFELPPNFRVTFKMSPGASRAQFDNNNVAVLPAGTRVDSYLLHLDCSKRTSPLGGDVEFDQPILGVIARGDQLIATDEVIGLPGEKYETSSPRARGLKTGDKKIGPDVLLFKTANTAGIFCSPKPGVVNELRIIVHSKQ